MKPNNVSKSDNRLPSEKSPLIGVAFLGLAILALLGVISLISQPFAYTESLRRPILEFVGLLITATLLSILAIRFGLKVKQNQKGLLYLIIVLAISFRAVMCVTPPILEIDFYRYLWDGKALAEGVSPYAYSPQQILDADFAAVGASPAQSDLQKLASLSIASDSNHTILSRVHFPNHTTIYPPVSQFVFFLVAKATPADASIAFNTLAMRIALVGFDLGTVIVLLLILQAIGRHVSWLIAYAWNPLVLKEIANSIHLDSIAIFFMMLAILFVIRARLFPRAQKSAPLSGLSLGLAVGAKLFPVVVAPAIAVALFKNGKRKSVLFSIAFLATTAVVLYPVFSRYDATAKELQTTGPLRPEQHSLELLEQELGMVPEDTTSVAVTATSKDGLTSFLSSWRMNDVIFSTLYQNFKPSSDSTEEYWYVVVPNQYRLDVVNSSIAKFSDNPAFLLTRIITLAAFAIVYLCYLPRFYSGNEQQILVGLLSILFAFLMVQPTVNPWYWVWAIPLTCFASRWGWIGISAVLSVYYTRFFFESSGWGFVYSQYDYSGVAIFDHFVAWGEAIAIILLLIFAGRLDRENSDQPDASA